MYNENIALMAHLLRRAGFGATRDELEVYAKKGYEETVDELIHPEEAPAFNDDILFRYEPYQRQAHSRDPAQAYWMFRMVNTPRPLEEKMTLFWHGLFATGVGKINHPGNMLTQLEMFRSKGLGRFPQLLVELSKDGAMLHWLDNKDNHKDAINENYGRELLELFSMGVGNYTEDDVKSAARAFTGWNIVEPPNFIVGFPYGRFNWRFQFRSEDHDYGKKTFLGQKGYFNGEDVVDIIARNPATALFVAKELYNFFVADLPGNPSWQPSGDIKAAINILADAYMSSNYEIRAVLQVLFTSDFFKSKESRFAKVKSPTELVVGILRLTKDFHTPHPYRMMDVAMAPTYMGQELLEPPSVEGWHSGEEWIDSGGLVERVNFAAAEVGDPHKPGVRSIIDRLEKHRQVLNTTELIDDCLDLLGPIPVSPKTHLDLLEFAESGWNMRFDKAGMAYDFHRYVADILRLIVSTREFQFC